MLINKTNENMENLISFETGKTYLMSWITDSDLKTPWKVIKRTAKFVTLQDVQTKETARCKVFEWDGVEKCYPLGVYSMAPSLKASKEVK